MKPANIVASTLADFVITLATNYSVQRKFDEYQNDEEGLRQYLVTEFQLDTADINAIVEAQQQPADSDPYKVLAERTQTSFEAWNVK